MTNSNSILFKEISQNKNRFSVFPKSATVYCIYTEFQPDNKVEIHVPGRAARTVWLTLTKVSLLKVYTTHVPGSFVRGYDERMRRRHAAASKTV